MHFRYANLYTKLNFSVARYFIAHGYNNNKIETIASRSICNLNYLHSVNNLLASAPDTFMTKTIIILQIALKDRLSNNFCASFKVGGLTNGFHNKSPLIIPLSWPAKHCARLFNGA